MSKTVPLTFDNINRVALGAWRDYVTQETMFSRLAREREERRAAVYNRDEPVLDDPAEPANNMRRLGSPFLIGLCGPSPWFKFERRPRRERV